MILRQSETVKGNKQIVRSNPLKSIRYIQNISFIIVISRRVIWTGETSLIITDYDCLFSSVLNMFQCVD